MQLKVLVTGANGMLASSLCPLLAAKDYKVYLTDLVPCDNAYKLDVRNLNEVLNFVRRYKPDLIFHLAAETDVDKCELNRDYAFQTNFEGTKNVAIACKETDIPIVYISTGAVFDGAKSAGYTENDLPNPLNIYGKSKLEGEKFISALLTKYYIARAGWMIGGYKKDKKFVWKIIQLLGTQKEIPVVVDKVGSPTFTGDFAKGLLTIISTGRYGIYHCVNKGICSRFDIASKIVEFLGKKDVVLKPVTSDAFALPAPRANSEALINYNLSLLGLDNIRPWEDALKEYLRPFV